MKDWTINRGRTNSSVRFLDLVDDVSSVLRGNGGQCLDAGWCYRMATLIVARMAHLHGLAPAKKMKP